MRIEITSATNLKYSYNKSFMVDVFFLCFNVNTFKLMLLEHITLKKLTYALITAAWNCLNSRQQKSQFLQYK